MSVSRLHLEAGSQKTFFGGNFVKKLRIFTVLATMFVGHSVFGAGWSGHVTISSYRVTGSGTVLFNVSPITNIVYSDCGSSTTNPKQWFGIRPDHADFEAMVNGISLAYATGDVVKLQINTNYCMAPGIPAINDYIIDSNGLH